MTKEQIIEEIPVLSQEERQQILHYFQKREAENQVRYLDHAKAKPIIERILTERAELFRKLAE